MEKEKRKKKPNKLQRDKARAEKADIYEQGFLHGYNMGYEQAKKEIAGEDLIGLQRGRKSYI